MHHKKVLIFYWNQCGNKLVEFTWEHSYLTINASMINHFSCFLYIKCSENQLKRHTFQPNDISPIKVNFSSRWKIAVIFSRVDIVKIHWRRCNKKSDIVLKKNDNGKHVMCLLLLTGKKPKHSRFAACKKNKNLLILLLHLCKFGLILILYKTMRKHAITDTPLKHLQTNRQSKVLNRLN